MISSDDIIRARMTPSRQNGCMETRWLSRLPTRPQGNAAVSATGCWR